VKRAHLIGHAAIWSLTAVPAAIVAATPGLAAAARAELGFALRGSPGTAAEAAGIAANNARVLAAILLTAYAAGRAARVRPALDALVALTVATNAAIVGTALGAYGTRGLPWLVHLPLEWAAIGLVAGSYLERRRAPAPLGALARAAAGAVLIVVAAALIETYATPQT